MLKNYFTLAIKVLGRRKFFTFISLFGISFTLMILMLITAFFQTELGGDAPLGKKDQLVYLDYIETFKQYQDTIPEVDSTMMDGVMRYDTTGFKYEDSGRSMSRGPGSIKFWTTHMEDVPFVKTRTIYTAYQSFDIFINSNKLTFSSTFTDGNFFDIYNFKFLAGGPFGNQQLENQAQVVVLSQEACKKYFGINEGNFDEAIGKEITLDRKNYKVIGVIGRVNNSFGFLKSDVFVPYTNAAPEVLNREQFNGSFSATFLAENASKTNNVKEELVKRSKVIPLPKPEQHDQLEYYPATYTERYAWTMVRMNKPEESYKYALGAMIFLLTLFFMLPTLNLINLNISRIMERSSEIGVRKAFGAHSGNILFQFVFENIVLTFIGGVVGFILAFLLLNTINGSNFLNGTILSFNYKVFIYSFLICLGFGVLSGFLPAWRMSRVHIVNAIKNNQL
jgi:putative ABC transport system permease protein